jgi:hypothetical protein
MNFFISILCFYVGISLLLCGIIGCIKSYKKLKKRKILCQFTILFTEIKNLDLNDINEKIQKLLNMDIPTKVHESQKLEHFVIRLRYLDFPENTLVIYKGQSLKV